MPAPPADEVIARLVRTPPAFHHAGGEEKIWHALPGTLEMIGRLVGEGDRTVETGAGASTVVFAAKGARHTAISPAPDEHAAIARYLHEIGIETPVEFVAGSSDVVLAKAEGELDAAFVDGAHSFPFPALDWHYLCRRLRIGGILMLDDVPIPAVAPLFRHMRDEPGWELLEVADGRAAAFRKLADPPAGDDWRRQRINAAYPDFGFLPLGERFARGAAHRAALARRAMARRYPALGRARRALRGRPR